MEEKTGKLELNGLVIGYERQGFEKEDIELLRSDLNYGLTKEEVAVYMDSRYTTGQKRILSNAIKNEYSDTMMKALTFSGINEYQMREIVAAYEKGIPDDEICSIVLENHSAHEMKKCFRKALKYISEKSEEISREEAEKESAAGEIISDEENIEKQENNDKLSINTDSLVEEIVSKVASLLKEQEDNKADFSVINDKLDELKGTAIQADAEESYKRQLAENERMLDDQQNKLNDASARINSLEQENRNLREENEKMKRELEDLRKEIAGQKEQRDVEKSGNTTGVTDASGKPSQSSTTGMRTDLYYQVTAKDGTVIPVNIERMERKRSKGMFAVASEKLFNSKTSRNLVRQLMGKGLNAAQMEQIKVAIENGLTDEEVADLIESGFDAEMMAQTIQIVIADRQYS